MLPDFLANYSTIVNTFANRFSNVKIITSISTPHEVTYNNLSICYLLVDIKNYIPHTSNCRDDLNPCFVVQLACTLYAN